MATVNLVWTDTATTENGFRVYRTTTVSPSFPGDYTEIADLGTPDTTTYTDSSAPNGRLVHYAVTAYNAEGESSPTTASIRTNGSAQVTILGVAQTTADGALQTE